MTAVTIQELSQSRNLLNTIPKTKSFSNTFFLFCIKEWNKLDAKIRNLPSVSRFKKSFLIYFKTDENLIFDAQNPIAIKLLNRLNESHLNEHKFHHNFQDTVNPLCLCNTETETISHYLLRCSLFSERRTKLLESLSNLDNTLLNHCDDDIVNILLYGSSTYGFPTNNKILSLTVDFLESTKRFDKPLFVIAYTFHRHMTLFQRSKDVDVLSAISCGHHTDVWTMSCVQLAGIHV